MGFEGGEFRDMNVCEVYNRYEDDKNACDTGYNSGCFVCSCCRYCYEHVIAQRAKGDREDARGVSELKVLSRNSATNKGPATSLAGKSSGSSAALKAVRALSINFRGWGVTSKSDVMRISSP